MNFMVMALVVAVASVAITVKILVGYNDFRLAYKCLIAIVVAAGWFAPLWLAGVRKLAPPSGFPGLGVVENCGYFLFGFAFILLVLILARDFTWFAAHRIAKSVVDPMDSAAILKANLATAAVAGVLAVYALYAGTKVPAFEEVVLSSPKIKRETVIVAASDLHLTAGTSVARIRKIVDKINALEPDAVLLAGDIIDDKVALIQEPLAELGKLRARHGVYAAIGNHEIYRSLPASADALSRAGFKVLLNFGERMGGRELFVAGVNDYGTLKRMGGEKIDMNPVLAKAEAGDYRILLSHTPFFIDTLADGEVDLQVSGHTHGGQIFPFSLAAGKANGGYLAGLYDVRGMKLFVSRGAGTWGPAMRLFAPADIAVIRLKPEPGSN